MLMTQRDRDSHSALLVAAVFVLVCILFALLSGCSSCADPCPPVVPPTVIEIPVYHPPEPIPTPQPPDLQLPDAADDTSSILEAVAHDWSELLRAYREALQIIMSYNSAVKEAPNGEMETD